MAVSLPLFDCVHSRTSYCLHLTCHSCTTGVMKAMICQHRGGMGLSQCWRVFVPVLLATQSIEMASVGRATMGDHAAVVVMVMMMVVVSSSLTCITSGRWGVTSCCLHTRTHTMLSHSLCP